MIDRTDLWDIITYNLHGAVKNRGKKIWWTTASGAHRRAERKIALRVYYNFMLTRVEKKKTINIIYENRNSWSGVHAQLHHDKSHLEKKKRNSRVFATLVGNSRINLDRLLSRRTLITKLRSNKIRLERL